MGLNILAVVAHPADAFDMIGGTLASHVEHVRPEPEKSVNPLKASKRAIRGR